MVLEMQRWNMPRICLWTLAANSETDGRSASMPAGPLPPPMPGRPACCGIKPNCCRNGDDLVKSCQHGPKREKLRMSQAKKSKVGRFGRGWEQIYTAIDMRFILRSLEWPSEKWYMICCQISRSSTSLTVSKWRIWVSSVHPKQPWWSMKRFLRETPDKCRTNACHPRKLEAPGVIFSASSNSFAARAKLAPPRPDSSMRWRQKRQILSKFVK